MAGAKDDAGKMQWNLLMNGAGLALQEIVKVLMWGAKKYAPNAWQQVPGAYDRYKDALYRHLHSIEQRGMLSRDDETGLLEWAHVGCNVVFLIWFAIKERENPTEVKATMSDKEFLAMLGNVSPNVGDMLDPSFRAAMEDASREAARNTPLRNGGRYDANHKLLADGS